MTVTRRPGVSVRMKLTLSYVGLLLLAWAAFATVLSIVVQYVPDESALVTRTQSFVGAVLGIFGIESPNRSEVAQLTVPIVLMGTVLLGLGGFAAGWVLAGWMLRPLESISAAARAAASGSLTHRIELDGPDDELRRLADVFDQMLDRLEQTFEEQRRFTSNASHELRTPNAVIKTMLEVARADPAGRDVDQLIDRVTEMNDRATATVEALLRLARVDHLDQAGGAGLALAPCDLARVVQDAVERLGEATERAVRLELELGPAVVDGDRVLLLHLVTNLLVNAHRHNLEADGVVRVQTGTGADGPVLVVENSGAVLDPALVSTLVEPFVRGVGRVRSAGVRTGSGLGLSIVASIARAHDAALALRARPAGGLEVTVTFPLPRPDAPAVGRPVRRPAALAERR